MNADCRICVDINKSATYKADAFSRSGNEVCHFNQPQLTLFCVDVENKANPQQNPNPWTCFAISNRVQAKVRSRRSFILDSYFGLARLNILVENLDPMTTTQYINLKGISHTQI